MKKSKFSGQGLIEYGIVIVIVAIVTIIGLAVSGEGIESNITKVCGALGNEDCIAAIPPTQVVEKNTAEPDVTITPTITLTPTPTLPEPNPTREVFSTPVDTPDVMPELKVIVVDDVSGEPVPSAWLQIKSPAGAYVAEARTDAAGQSGFQLQDGSYNIWVYSSQWWSAAEVVLTESQTVTVRMKTLTINVSDDASGSPSQGIWIIIKNGNGEHAAEGSSDANGKLSFPLVAGNYQVWVYTGQWWKAADVNLNASQTVNVILNTLTVKVVDDASGSSIKDVWVVLKNGSGEYIKEGSTNTSGKLTFPSLVNGKYQVWIYVGQWWQAAEVTLSDSETITVRLNTLKLKVISSGEGSGPLSGVWVEIYNESGIYVAGGTTNSKGEVSFSVVDGKYTVKTLYKKSWQTDGPYTVTNSRQYTIQRKASKNN